MGELLTVKEVTSLLKVTDRTVRCWMASGKLPAVRLSRRAVRIRSEDLRRLIDQGRGQGEGAAR